jgi:hypothetical protein
MTEDSPREGGGEQRGRADQASSPGRRRAGRPAGKAGRGGIPGDPRTGSPAGEPAGDKTICIYFLYVRNHGRLQNFCLQIAH